MRKLASFEVEYLQYLDENAKPANDLPDFARDPEELLKLYRSMQFLRVFDARAIALQRTGKLGTYAGSLGQEAVSIGAGSGLTDDDVLVPYYRGTGTMLQHGVKPHEMLLYWGGDERGSNFEDPRAKEDYPVTVPIATQTLHASGVASAIKFRKQTGRAVLTEIGEGGTSEGEFYEALNVAGVWNLGVVFMVNNNQWAISVPSELQTAAQTYAQKAIAAGVECVQVDGNDVIAVKDAAGRALEKARTGGGPTLIEAVTYRLCDHTTADDARRYHDPQKHEEAWEKEPLKRLGDYLSTLGAVSNGDLQDIEAECKREVENEVRIYLDTVENKPQSPADMFDYLFANLPEKTKPQREFAIARGAH
ncbi:MAG: pyruvate dehydrogenase (acetyl-transferring) E1 component subunit alpha [Sphingomonadales bacterium]